MKREYTESVHLNSPTNNLVSVVVIRRVLFNSDVRNVSASVLEPSIRVNGLVFVAAHLYEVGYVCEGELER